MVYKLGDLYILLIAAWMSGCVAPGIAHHYYVLVIDRVDQSDTAAIEQFQRSTDRLNGLHLEGFPAVRPYFNVLKLSDGRAYFVFGYRDKVQGLIREDFPNVQQNLRNYNFGGKLGYPDPQWVPVESIRRLLIGDKHS